MVLRWFFTNTEEFLRVLKLELLVMTNLIGFDFIYIFIILCIIQMLILMLVFLCISINYIIWVNTYIWNETLIIIGLISYIFILFLINLAAVIIMYNIHNTYYWGIVRCEWFWLRKNLTFIKRWHVGLAWVYNWMSCFIVLWHNQFFWII